MDPLANLPIPGFPASKFALVEPDLDASGSKRFADPPGVLDILRGIAEEFAAQARKKLHVFVDPKTKSRAYLLVGEEDWPFAIPIVKHSGWSFDADVGREELFNRRIGSNEFDAIEVCRGFLEAQNEYVFRKREGYEPAEYAQRIIAAPGQQDGLAWQAL